MTEADLIRELEKAETALLACVRHFNAAAEANAALHMSERVIPNPLAAATEAAARSATSALVRCGRYR